ncbi:MAG: DUF2530 domain-containing protein, partial [Actinomycetota bacterium]|nr:DUF2530 domain-containing protein [Actinomycetota bacterium]
MAKGRRARAAGAHAADVRVVTAGTALWALAFLALLPFTDGLARAGHGWWIWTCLAGVGLGLFGIELCRRRSSRG